MNHSDASGISAQALLEFSQHDPAAGATCAVLTPAIKARLRDLAPGDILEVRVDDPLARDDIIAWSRLSGNRLLAIVEDEPQHLRFYLQKK